MYPVALGTRRVHPLEPERRPAVARVDQDLVGAVGAVLVPEHGPPERHHLGADQRVDRDLDGLELGRVGGEAQLTGHRRELPGHLEVAAAQAVVVGDRDQPHGHAPVPQVDVGVVVLEAGQLIDRVHQPGAGRERPGAEVRARSFAQHPPVLDALGLVELPRRDPLGHARHGDAGTRMVSMAEG